MSGEHAGWDALLYGMKGSSPRERGALEADGTFGDDWGIIPA